MTTLFVVATAACQEAPADPMLATPDSPAASTDGDHLLSLLEGRDDTGSFLRVQVGARSASGARPVYTSERVFYTRHRTLAGWDVQGRAWVYSGDLGVFVLEQGSDGWSERDFDRDQDTPPDWLRREAAFLFD